MQLHFIRFFHSKITWALKEWQLISPSAHNPVEHKHTKHVLLEIDQLLQLEQAYAFFGHCFPMCAEYTYACCYNGDQNGTDHNRYSLVLLFSLYTTGNKHKQCRGFTIALKHHLLEYGAFVFITSVYQHISVESSSKLIDTCFMPDEGLISDIRASSDIPQILFGFYTNFAVLSTTTIAEECIFSGWKFLVWKFLGE